MPVAAGSIGWSDCLRSSRLPVDKSLEAFDLKRLPGKVFGVVRTLLNGSFVIGRERAGLRNPGAGKSHLLVRDRAGIGAAGRTVYFTSDEICLVQELLLAKRETCGCPRPSRSSPLRALILDDLGYVQQNRRRWRCSFTLLAERYERGSVLITSNLPLSKWDVDLQGRDDHGGGHRPPGASQRDPGVEPAQLPGGAAKKSKPQRHPRSPRRRPKVESQKQPGAFRLARVCCSCFATLNRSSHTRKKEPPWSSELLVVVDRE